MTYAVLTTSYGILAPRKLLQVCGLALFLLATACVKSPTPSIEDLNQIDPPKFTGQLSTIFNSPSTIYTVSGSCDVRSLGLQVSYDQVTWEDVPGGCPASGQFSKTLEVKTEVKVYARAKGRVNYTQAAVATVRFIEVPTATMLSFVSASASQNDAPLSVQAVVSHTFAGDSMSNGVEVLQSSLPAIAYEP